MKPGLSLAIVAAVALSACQSVPEPSRQAPGAFDDILSGDASVRQSLGGQMGAYLGRRLGRALEPGDEAAHDAAAAQALWQNTKGYGASWRNRDTGASGTVVPSSRVERTGEAQCRQFHDEVRLPGEPVFGVDGTACSNGQEWTVDF